MLMGLKSLFSPKERLYASFYGFGYEQSFVNYAQMKTAELGLLGWMNVVPNQSVEIEVEGPRIKLEKLLELLRGAAPRARLYRMEMSWRPFTGKLQDFRVRNN